MNINLNNYETFFLLYVDNELSAAEKLSVDEFIEQFPYLKEELAVLQEMVLPASNAIVFDKQQLYRSADAEETLQEAMLMHLDNELTGSDKGQLLNALQNSKALQLNWGLLKRSQLDANERITFPDKSILYRKEKGRLVTGKFVKWAVAAALIATGFFVGISIIKKQDAAVAEISKIGTEKIIIKDTTFNNKVTGIVKEESKTGEEAKEPLTVEQQKNNNNVARKITVEPKHGQKIKLIEDQQKYLTNNQEAINVKKQSLAEENKSDPLIIISTPSNNNIAKLEQPININSNAISSSVKGKPKPESMQESSDINIMPVHNSYAKTAVLNEDEQSHDRILFMDEEKLSNSKAGAFFKKVKRTVARHTKITAGNSLKIAGVEFAIN